MIGFLLGAAAAVGVAKVARRARCGGMGRMHGHFGHGHFGHGRGEGGRRGGMRFGRRMLRGVFERLETSPGQEKVILEAADQVRTAAEKFRGEARQTRDAFSRSMSGEHFDSTVINEAFARHDALLKELRDTATAQLSRVHEALDERQRRDLADLIDGLSRGGGFGRHHGFGGPWDSRYA